LIEVVQGVQKKLNKSASKGEKRKTAGREEGVTQITNYKRELKDKRSKYANGETSSWNFFFFYIFLSSFFAKIYDLQFFFLQN
jgi:hypothetical protein